MTDETPAAEDTPAAENTPAEDTQAAEAPSVPLPPPPPVGGDLPAPPPPGAGVPPAVPVARGKVVWPTQTKIIVLGGSALLLVASFLPWAKAEASVLGRTFSNTSSGMDGDGKITLVLALVAALVFLFVRTAKVAGGLVLAAGVLAGLIAIIDIVDVSNKANDLEQEFSSVRGVDTSATVSIGLWLVAVAAIVLIVGGALCLRQKDEAPAT